MLLNVSKAVFFWLEILYLVFQAGDTVGVVRKEDGSLHFFVNGVAQGPAAWNVPPSVYAVVDLYGQAAQATIMDDMGKEREEEKQGYISFCKGAEITSNYVSSSASPFISGPPPSPRGQLRGPHSHVSWEPLLSRRGQHDQRPAFPPPTRHQRRHHQRRAHRPASELPQRVQRRYCHFQQVMKQMAANLIHIFYGSQLLLKHLSSKQLAHCKQHATPYLCFIYI